MLRKQITTSVVAVLAIVASTLIISAQPASASAYACWYPFGSPNVCVDVHGESDVVDWAAVTHRHDNKHLCNSQAYNGGLAANPDGSAAGNWAYVTNKVPYCVYRSQQISITVNKKFVAPSWYYGKFAHDGIWHAEKPGILIHR